MIGHPEDTALKLYCSKGALWNIAADGPLGLKYFGLLPELMMQFIHPQWILPWAMPGGSKAKGYDIVIGNSGSLPANPTPTVLWVQAKSKHPTREFPLKG